MNVLALSDTVTQDAARMALLEYKEHRSAYDARDWEIERIYRQIAKGKKVISPTTYPEIRGTRNPKTSNPSTSA